MSDGGVDPFNGALYVFRFKRADQVKIVWWDGSGICLYEPELPPGCEEVEKVLIGEDVLERLDVTAARLRVIVTRRSKYAFRGRDGVIQAPAHLVESGIPSEALLARIVVSKYADRLPLYRHEAINVRGKGGAEPVTDGAMDGQSIASLLTAIPCRPSIRRGQFRMVSGGSLP